MFNNNFQFEIVKQFSDPEGRFILVDLKIDIKMMTFNPFSFCNSLAPPVL